MSSIDTVSNDTSADRPPAAKADRALSLEDYDGVVAVTRP
jgi:hypothetical protein